MIAHLAREVSRMETPLLPVVLVQYSRCRSNSPKSLRVVYSQDCVSTQLLNCGGSRQRAARNQHLSQVRNALSEQRPVRHHGPLAVAQNFPAIKVLAVEKRLEIGRGKGRRGARERAITIPDVGFTTLVYSGG